MNDKPAQRKLRKKKGEKGNKGAGDPDVCSAVFMVLSADEECIIAADLIVGFKLVGVTLSPEEAETMMILLDPSDDDSCIDVEELTPMCERSLLGFNPGSTSYGSIVDLSGLKAGLAVLARSIKNRVNRSLSEHVKSGPSLPSIAFLGFKCYDLFFAMLRAIIAIGL